MMWALANAAIAYAPDCTPVGRALDTVVLALELSQISTIAFLFIHSGPVVILRQILKRFL